MKQEFSINRLCDIAKEAGEIILKVYADPAHWEVKEKADHSPVTIADQLADRYITEQLKRFWPEIPVVSEEGEGVSWEIRKDAEYIWLVDPLDGTKEFIKRNGEFTVNIALIQKGIPIIGVIYAPAKNIIGFTNADGLPTIQGLEKFETNHPGSVIMGSRSHKSTAWEEYISQSSDSIVVEAGSSLKFLYLAAGLADVYPRFGPTMEWDTAAGHAILMNSGGSVRDMVSEDSLKYNKENLLNPNFFARRKA